MLTGFEKNNLNDINRYRLCFSKRIGRHIVAVEDEKPLIHKMAEILELQLSSQNNLPKLIFSRTDSLSQPNIKIINNSYEDVSALLPDKNWKETEFNLLKIYTHPEVSDVVCRVPEKRDAACDMVILSFVYYQIYRDLLEKGGLPLHGGLIELDSQGIILAGSSGTGKSTCCSRVPKPWKSICDDEVLIIPEIKNSYRIHPVPTWSDYFFNAASQNTWDVQKGFSCAALFFLEKADAEDAVPSGQGRAAVRIYQSAMESFSRYFPYLDEIEQKKISRKVFESACELAKNVPVFILRISETGPFWKNIENEISKLNQTDVANI